MAGQCNGILTHAAVGGEMLLRDLGSTRPDSCSRRGTDSTLLQDSHGLLQKSVTCTPSCCPMRRSLKWYISQSSI